MSAYTSALFKTSRVPGERDFEIHLIGGDDVEQMFLESEWTRSKETRTRYTTFIELPISQCRFFHTLSGTFCRVSKYPSLCCQTHESARRLATGWMVQETRKQRLEIGV